MRRDGDYHRDLLPAVQWPTSRALGREPWDGKGSAPEQRRDGGVGARARTLREGFCAVSVALLAAPHAVLICSSELSFQRHATFLLFSVRRLWRLTHVRRAVRREPTLGAPQTLTEEGAAAGPGERHSAPSTTSRPQQSGLFAWAAWA